MAIFGVVFGALALGLVIVIFIGVSAPKAAPMSVAPEGGASPLADLSSEELAKVVATLLDRMGIEFERSQGAAHEVIEIYAVNPAPVTGGKILVHCLAPPKDRNVVDGRMVANFVRAVRSAYVSKGLLFTTGVCTPDAWLEAEDAPVEIFDRERLGRLVEEQLEGVLTGANR